MGGTGSGRHKGFGSRDTTDDYISIDIRRWHREGHLLAPGRTFGWQWSRHGETTASIRVRPDPGRIVLTYRHRRSGEDWVDESYPVRLEWTPCHFGGERPWFRCPQCGRRVAILYSGTKFMCRHCHQLAYPSQGEAFFERMARRADKLRERLGWEPGMLNGSGDKPKGMHWSTFERLTAQHDAMVGISLAGLRGQIIF